MTITIVFKFLLFPLMHLNWHNIMWEEFETLSKWNFTAAPAVNKLAKLNDVMPLVSNLWRKTEPENLAWLHKTMGLSSVEIFSVWIFHKGDCSSLTSTLTGPFWYYQAQTHGAHPNPSEKSADMALPQHYASTLVGIINSLWHRWQW